MCSCQGAETKQFNISGGNDEGVPPVPIPNTEVKPFSAESTWLDTAREDRSLPESIWKKSQDFFFFCVRGGENVELSAARRMVVERMGAWWRGIHKCGLNCGKVGEEIPAKKAACV